jgi:hypothetical protein
MIHDNRETLMNHTLLVRSSASKSHMSDYTNTEGETAMAGASLYAHRV